METSTLPDLQPTIALEGQPVAGRLSNELTDRYERMVHQDRLSWTTHQRLIRLLGKGGQGTVYLSERRGADDFTLPIAIKIFSPVRYATVTEYDEVMGQIARVAARVAQIQQDNLLDVHNFVDRNGIRLMVMEWVDGFDLRQLLDNRLLERFAGRVSMRRWEHINNVLATPGPCHPRIKPGVAVAIMRDCLAALAALHRHRIVHGDIKPSNIMLKCTGDGKIVDIGSAFQLDQVNRDHLCTPRYAAPEVLERRECTPRSDLASLGYVLIEMLSGQPLFSHIADCREYVNAKYQLPHRLHEILPVEVTCNQLLMKFCRGLVAPDPSLRFPNAEKADLEQEGAAAFHRQLVLTNLAAEYRNEIRLWLEEIKEMTCGEIADDSK